MTGMYHMIKSLELIMVTYYLSNINIDMQKNKFIIKDNSRFIIFINILDYL